jgi:hypothetical protein
MAAITSSVMGDPFAAAPMKPLKTTPTSRHRSASPTVSVVHEGSEEGSRWTKFSTMTAEKGNPNDHSPLFNVIREYDGPASPRSSLGQQAESSVSAANSQQLGSDRQAYLPPKSVEVLKRLDAVLSLSGDDPARPTMLDDPPRKLLLCTQVLQVVNSNVGFTYPFARCADAHRRLSRTVIFSCLQTSSSLPNLYWLVGNPLIWT